MYAMIQNFFCWIFFGRNYVFNLIFGHNHLLILFFLIFYKYNYQPDMFLLLVTIFKPIYQS